MCSSKMIAGLVGPTFMALGGMVLLNQNEVWVFVHDATAGPLIVMLSGILVLVAGLAILRVHNLWVKGWPVVVTLVGWAGVVSGVARMLFPMQLLGIASKLLDVA